MRMDNYIIALVESGILDINLTKRWRFFNIYLEQAIRVSILDGLFDSTEAKVRMLKVSVVKIRLFIFALVSLVMGIPLLLINLLLELF